jgi:esterase
MKLFFRKSGKGKPIIILHGLFGMSDNWVSFANRFPEGFEVFLPDLRNHGQSPHSMDFNYEVMAEDLYELIRDQQLKNIVLMGHSMGGKLAMHFALRFPKLLSKLIVIDMSTRFYPPHHGHIFEALEKLDLSGLSSRKDAAEKLLLEDEGTKQFLLKNLYRTDATPPVFAWRFDLPAIRANLAEIGVEIQGSRQAKVEDMHFPALFVKGEKSTYILKEDMEKIHTLFPLASLVEIPGAGHWVHADKPGELFNEVFRFIGS